VDVDHDETAPMLVRCALCKRSRKGVKHCIRKGHVPQSKAEVEGENDETPCLMQCSQCKGSRKGIKYCIERGHTVQAEAGMNHPQTHIEQQDMMQQKKCADDRNVLLQSGLRETNVVPVSCRKILRFKFAEQRHPGHASPLHNPMENTDRKVKKQRAEPSSFPLQQTQQKGLQKSHKRKQPDELHGETENAEHNQQGAVDDPKRQKVQSNDTSLSPPTQPLARQPPLLVLPRSTCSSEKISQACQQLGLASISKLDCLAPTFGQVDDAVSMPKMGPAAIGRRLEVWWDTDGAWYSAQVRRYDAKSGQHFLEYDDGDTEWADLAHEESQGCLSWSIRPCDVPSRGAAQSRASCSSAGKQASDQRTSKGALQCASPISMPCAKCKLSRKGITHCLERGHDKPPAVVKDEDDGPHLMQCLQCKVARKGMQHCIERGHVLQLKATVDVDHDETAPMLVRCALCKRSRKGVKHCIRKGHVPQSEAEVEGENDETPCLMQCSQCKGSRKGIKYCIERGHTVQTESVDV